MKDKVFLDTNVLIYLFSATELTKRNISLKILKDYNCVTSTQGLNEFANVNLKKYKMSHNDIEESIGNIARICRLCYISQKTVYSAIEMNKTYGYSYYDCLMLASAIEEDCTVLFSEDMSNQHQINSKLNIINPYITI
jgi:predicted nucleic acid-binding protein